MLTQENLNAIREKVLADYPLGGEDNVSQLARTIAEKSCDIALSVLAEYDRLRSQSSEEP